MDDLSITKSSPHPTSKPRAKSAIADSWEEETLSSGDEQTEGLPDTHTVPSAPPPTPMSPNFKSGRSAMSSMDERYGPSTSSPGIDSSLLNPARATQRPEKQVNTAGRMIAGALGVRPPKQTEEQKEYARVAKENEIRRREKEKEEKVRGEEERAKARAAVWED